MFIINIFDNHELNPCLILYNITLRGMENRFPIKMVLFMCCLNEK